MQEIRSREPEIRFNAQLQRRADFMGVIPADYVLWWAGILGLFLVPALLFQSLFDTNIPNQYWLMIPLGWGVHVFLLGKNPYKYLSQFHRPKKEILAHVHIKPSKFRVRPMINKAALPFLKNNFVEDAYDLSAIIDYRLKDERVGALYLESGNRVRLVFGFDCSGISSTLLKQQYKEISERLDRGLRDFQRKGESFTIRAGSFSNCESRLQELEEIQTGNRPEIQYLMRWEKKGTEYLTAKGKHQPKKLRLYLTYTFDNRFEAQANPVQTGIAFIESLFSRTAEPVTTRFEKLLREGFRQGYRGHQRYLKRLGLSVTPLGFEKLYEDSWALIQDGRPDHVPIVYPFTSSGVGDPIETSDFSLLAHLFNGAVPVLKKDYIYLPGRETCVGVAVLNSRPILSWEATERKKQLFFAIEALFDSDTRDTELIFQVTPEDPREAQRRANRLGSQGDSAQNSAASHGRRNRAAEFATEETDIADKALRRGERSIKFSLVALVYRPTPEDLDIALNDLEGCECYGGSILARETEYAAQIWKETLPFTYRDQLTSGGFAGLTFSEFDRCLTDTTQASLAFAPLIRDVSRDQKGLMFIAKNGRTPLFIDLFKEDPWVHAICQARTGYGKSAMICALIAYARARSANVTVFDADLGDGQGSYRALLDFLGGAYFSPTLHKSNIFEGTDFRKIIASDPTEAEEKREAAEKTFTNFLVNALTDLSIPEARDILSLLVAAFQADDEIIDRRKLAFDGGMDSPAWAQFPTLYDFLDFATVERLPVEFQNERQKEILNDCRAKLKAKLALPSGQAIAQPSTFPSDCPFTVVSLGDAATNDDALPTVLAGQANFLRTALNSTTKNFLIADEISRTRRFKSIDTLCGDVWSRGRKLGITGIAIGQNIDGLKKMQSEGDIFSNTDLYFTGAIRREDVPGCVSRGLPEELVSQCATDKDGNTRGGDFEYLPKREMARRWLISQGGRHYFADSCINPALFALAMNQQSEKLISQKIKQEVRSRDKYKILTALTKEIMKGTIYDS